jgi:hypothetical protein
MPRFYKYETDDSGTEEFVMRMSRTEAHALLALLQPELGYEIPDEQREQLLQMFSGEFYKDVRDTIGGPTPFELKDEDEYNPTLFLGLR